MFVPMDVLVRERNAGGGMRQRETTGVIALVARQTEEAMRRVRVTARVAVAAALLSGCGSGTLSGAVRSWSARNLPHYKTLVDEKYAGPSHKDTRENAYQSMAALACTVDTADGKADSAACKCQKATDPKNLEPACDAFFKSLAQ